MTRLRNHVLWTLTIVFFVLIGSSTAHSSAPAPPAHSSVPAPAQNGNWIWVSGSNQTDDKGLFTNPSPNFKPDIYPPAGRAPCMVYSAKRHQLFVQVIDQIWAYDIAKREWAYLWGSGSFIGGAYSPLLDLSNSTSMSARNQTSCTLDPKEENMWIFGGNQYDDYTSVQPGLDQLWSFNLQNRNWTKWYGNTTWTDMVDSIGRRNGGYITFNTSSTILILSSHSIEGQAEDLWEFNTSNNTMRLIEDDFKHDPDPAYHRSNNGSFYMFGKSWKYRYDYLGRKYDSADLNSVDKTKGSLVTSFSNSGADYFVMYRGQTNTPTALWMLNITNGIWKSIWTGQNSFSLSYSEFQNVISDLARPGFRVDSAGAVDRNGILWLFGGTTTGSLDSTGPPVKSADFADLWAYTSCDSAVQHLNVLNTNCTANPPSITSRTARATTTISMTSTRVPGWDISTATTPSSTTVTEINSVATPSPDSPLEDDSKADNRNTWIIGIGSGAALMVLSVSTFLYIKRKKNRARAKKAPASIPNSKSAPPGFASSFTSAFPYGPTPPLLQTVGIGKPTMLPSYASSPAINQSNTTLRNESDNKKPGMAGGSLPAGFTINMESDLVGSAATNTWINTHTNVFTHTHQTVYTARPTMMGTRQLGPLTRAMASIGRTAGIRTHVNVPQNTQMTMRSDATTTTAHIGAPSNTIMTVTSTSSPTIIAGSRAGHAAPPQNTMMTVTEETTRIVDDSHSTVVPVFQIHSAPSH